MYEKRIVHLLAFTFLFLFYLLPSVHAEGEVKIKILAMNPSPSKQLESIVKQNLPPEVRPEDVVDNAGMEVKYNSEDGVYYLSKQVTLAPKESLTIEVKIRNVWLLPEERLAKVKENLDGTTKALVGTKYEKTIQLLRDRITERLGGIEEEQARSIGISKRIELYRAHLKQLDSIEHEIVSIGSLRELEDEQAVGMRTAKLVISAENPSSETRKMTVRSDLPKEISANDILDKLDFLLLYDDTKKRFSLEKDDQFAGNETKKYEIILRDIWYIPQGVLDHHKEQAEKLLGHLKGSAYESYSAQQGVVINETLASIAQLQAEVQGAEAIQDKIKAYELNSERLALVAKKIKELQDLLLEVPIKRQVSEIEKIKQAIKSLTKVMDVIRMGFKPDLSTTWWIILGIIAFLIVLSTTFYVTWLSRLKDARGAGKADKKGKKGAAAKSDKQPQAPAGVPAAAPAEGKPS